MLKFSPVCLRNILKMNLNLIKPSPALWTILLIFIAFELCCCHAQGTNNSSSNDSNLATTRRPQPKVNRERRAFIKKKVITERINIFLVTFPCFVIFAFVFVCYTFIWKQQRLHGWIVLAITGSLCLRFGVIFLIDLPVFYFRWQTGKSLNDLCVLYGEHQKYFPFLMSAGIRGISSILYDSQACYITSSFSCATAGHSYWPLTSGDA